MMDFTRVAKRLTHSSVVACAFVIVLSLPAPALELGRKGPTMTLPARSSMVIRSSSGTC